MTEQHDAVSAALTALKIDFLHRLHDQLIEVQAAWVGLLRDRGSAALRYELEIKAHSLAGNCGIFGLGTVAAAAAELEEAVATRWPCPDDLTAEIERLALSVARTVADLAQEPSAAEQRAHFA